MIARLSDLSSSASPTPFHNLLRALDDKGKLLRVYTQNIDALELKAGLSFGLPQVETRRRAAKRTTQATTEAAGCVMSASPVLIPEANVGVGGPFTRHPGTSLADSDPISQPSASTSTSPSPVLPPSRLPTPPPEIPRCIPLHGTLQSMHCPFCTHRYPLTPFLPSLASGIPPPCPECTSLEATRQLVGKRSRGVGRLRPSVVLYNEEHKDAEGVGSIVGRDLIGGWRTPGLKGKGKEKEMEPNSTLVNPEKDETTKDKGKAKARPVGQPRSRPDLLLVVGTSLRIPGTKRIVREFSKAVKFQPATSSKEKGAPDHTSQLPTPTPSPTLTPPRRRSPQSNTPSQPSSSQLQPASAQVKPNPPPIKTIYLNLDFPVPTREWDSVFDVWIQGDAQSFAEIVQEELDSSPGKTYSPTDDPKSAEEPLPSKRKRDVETNGLVGDERLVVNNADSNLSRVPIKKRKVTLIVRPRRAPSTPPSTPSKSKELGTPATPKAPKATKAASKPSKLPKKKAVASKSLTKAKPKTHPSASDSKPRRPRSSVASVISRNPVLKLDNYPSASLPATDSHHIYPSPHLSSLSSSHVNQSPYSHSSSSIATSNGYDEDSLEDCKSIDILTGSPSTSPLNSDNEDEDIPLASSLRSKLSLDYITNPTSQTIRSNYLPIKFVPPYNYPLTPRTSSYPNRSPTSPTRATIKSPIQPLPVFSHRHPYLPASAAYSYSSYEDTGDLPPRSSTHASPPPSTPRIMRGFLK